jgi:SnoaL-like domain
MKKPLTAPALGLCVAALIVLALGLHKAAAEKTPDERAIERVITTYALAVDKADTRLADQVFSNGPEVTFIHPQGEEHGRAQIDGRCISELDGEYFLGTKTHAQKYFGTRVRRYCVVRVQLGLLREGKERR